MKLEVTKNYKKSEAGNVLFLILIAVALFAALSYAVTQSSRSGGSGSDREQGIVNAAGLTQYASSIRTAILRLTINNIGVDQILYDQPVDIAANDEENSLFHPSGGGATWQTAPSNVLAAGADGEWHFNDTFAIHQIGTATTEILALLPGVTVGVCEEINRRYNIDNNTDPNVPNYNVASGVLDETVGQGTSTNANTTYVASGAGTAPTAWPTTGVLSGGQPFGCFCASNSACTASDTFVYYHTLVER